MSEYAPVHNRDGQIVGLIGIDVSLKRIDSKFAPTSRAGFLSLELAALLALLMGLDFSRTIFDPLVRLQKALLKVGQGLHPALRNPRPRMKSRPFNTVVSQLRQKNLIKANLGKSWSRRRLTRFLPVPCSWEAISTPPRSWSAISGVFPTQR